jgi:hypothetical protein
MKSIQKEPMTKLKFISKVGTMGETKMHVLIPKPYHELAKKMLGKQIRIVMDDEI